jgi:G2/mitotic-specific cyclin-B3
MDLLTLSRYILESSLLHSQFSSESDSLVASAALWLASCMSKKAEEKEEQTALWTTALQHYTGWFLVCFVKFNQFLNSLFSGTERI